MGTWICFRTSQRKPERHGFVPRYVCPGLPVLLRVLAQLVGVGLLVSLFSALVVEIPAVERYLETGETTLLDVHLTLLVELLCFDSLDEAIRRSHA